MRYRSRVDNNQAEIVKALRKAGLEVLHLHMVGKGCPDLLVSSETEMWLIEVKETATSKLTESQVKFFMNWKGKKLNVARSVEDALSICGKQP